MDNELSKAMENPDFAIGFLNISLEKNFLAYKNIKKKWNKKNLKNSNKRAGTSNMSHSGI